MKKAAFYLALFFIVGGAAWFASRYFRRPIQNTPTARDEQGSTEKMKGEAPSALIKRPADLKRPPGVDDEGWRRLQLAWRLMQQENQPIEFHLRVIDQYGQPVSGALLTTDLTRADEEKLKAENFLQLRPGEEIVTESLKLASDNDGWIHFKGTGKYVFLGNGTLSKDGYIWNRPPTLGTLIFEPGKRRATVSVEMHNAFDPKKGYTFHLWKQAETERTRPLSIGVDMDQQAKGRWVSNYFVSFFQNTATTTPFAGVDLLIQGIRHETGVPNAPYEFTITLAVPNGGLVESDDVYPFHAPESGYQTSWTFVNKPRTRGPEDRPWTKSFYFRSRDGRAFAGARVSFQKNGFNLIFEGNLNPNGSRNLEPDPSKQITDPDEIRRLDEATRVK